MGGPDQIGSVGRRPAERKVAGLIPGQGTCLGYGFGPWSGCVQEATDQCFSPFFLPPVPSKSE